MGQHYVVEVLDLELVPELLLRLVAEAKDFRFSDHVSEGLPRHDEVAIDLVRRLFLGERGVLEEEFQRLLAVPFQSVHPRIHHQARGAPGLVAEHAEARRRTGIEVHLVRQPLRVQSPALDVGGLSHLPAEVGQRKLLGDRALQMVPRHRLVEAERLAVVERASLRFVDVDVVHGGLRASVRRGLVEGRHVRSRAIRLDGAGHDGERRGIAEGRGQRRRGALERRPVPGEQLFRRPLELVGPVPELRAERRDVGPRLFLRDGLHLLRDGGEEARSEVVDLLRRALSAGVVRDERRVAGLAARQRPQAHVGAGARQQLAREEVAIAPQTRQRGILDRGPDPLARSSAVSEAGKSLERRQER